MSELNIYENRTYATEPLLSVSVEWSTQITENRGGKENRIPKITEPRFTIEGSDFVLRDDDYDLFKQFFIDSEGKAGTFPFKCPLDYYCSHEPEYFDADSYCQGIVVGIENGNSRIIKKYTVGSVSSYKTIIKPVEGTVLIYDGETLVDPTPTIDYETGIITGDYDGMTVSCQFRLPMRFDVDDLQLTQIKRAIDDARIANDTSIYIPVNFRLVEDMNYDRSSPLLAEDWKTTNDYIFDGSPLADVTYADRKLTRISVADNKREVKDGLNINRRKYLIADNAMRYLSTVRYYNLFMASKGRLVPFEFENTLVRLDDDVFSAQMESSGVWNVTGLDMIEVLNGGEDEIKTWGHFIGIGIGSSSGGDEPQRIVVYGNIKYNWGTPSLIEELGESAAVWQSYVIESAEDVLTTPPYTYSFNDYFTTPQQSVGAKLITECPQGTLSTIVQPSFSCIVFEWTQNYIAFEDFDFDLLDYSYQITSITWEPN